MNQIEFGDCRAIMRRWAAEGVRVQTCVTSPPYYGLRDYGHAGQIGLEQTPEQYIAAMVEVFRCVRDVLADDGTLWLNIGDSAGPKKQILGIPWRLAFALQADGWTLRQDIIWQKPNPMPESVRDRCTKSHEYVFLLTKRERYFFDSQAMQEPAVGSEKDLARAKITGRGEQAGSRASTGAPQRDKSGGFPTRSRADSFKREDSKREQPIPGQAVGTHRPDRAESAYPVDMRNRRSVWTVATRPYKGAHFATFPPALIEPCVLAGTSARGHCPACGSRWTPQVERTPMVIAKTSRNEERGTRTGTSGTMQEPARSVTTGWLPSCACGVEPTPDIVLDPFMGSGTTAAVSVQNGRQFLGCELNPEYHALQVERIAATGRPAATPRKPRAPAAAQAPRQPAPQPQADLFGLDMAP